MAFHCCAMGFGFIRKNIYSNKDEDKRWEKDDAILPENMKDPLRLAISLYFSIVMITLTLTNYYL